MAAGAGAAHRGTAERLVPLAVPGAKRDLRGPHGEKGLVTSGSAIEFRRCRPAAVRAAGCALLEARSRRASCPADGRSKLTARYIVIWPQPGSARLRKMKK
jgi:hypothetical protein